MGEKHYRKQVRNMRVDPSGQTVRQLKMMDFRWWLFHGLTLAPPNSATSALQNQIILLELEEGTGEGSQKKHADMIEIWISKYLFSRVRQVRAKQGTSSQATIPLRKTQKMP